MTDTPIDAALRPDADRVKRICDVCAGYDDHPRHVIGYAPGGAPEPDMTKLAVLLNNGDLTGEERAAAVADFMETSQQLRHMDCCRAVGCPDGSCQQVTAGAEGLRGAALVEHLTSREG